MANDGRILIYYDELVTALARQYGETMDTHIYSPRDILSSMQGISRVDAVEVVRCKDCTYCEKAFDDYWCNYHWNYVPTIKPKQTREDGFCHNGERREGE